jgi:tetratricopeptide (TPR) repeat protein
VHALDGGDLDRAASAASEALALDQAAGEAESAAQSAGIVADVAAHRGDLDTAAEMYEVAAEQARAFGDDRELAVTLYNLGNVRRLQDAEEQAEELFVQALAGFRKLGDDLGQGGTLLSLIGIHESRGEYGPVSELLAQSAGLLAEIGFTSGLLDVVEVAARVAADVGRAEAAARLYGAFNARSEDLGRAGVHPAELAGHDASVGQVRSSLGAEPFEAAWAEGADLAVEAAVAYALETVSSIASAETVPAPMNR